MSIIWVYVPTGKELHKYGWCNVIRADREGEIMFAVENPSAEAYGEQAGFALSADRMVRRLVKPGKIHALEIRQTPRKKRRPLVTLTLNDDSPTVLELVCYKAKVRGFEWGVTFCVEGLYEFTKCRKPSVVYVYKA
jgi:hypothetical protein